MSTRESPPDGADPGPTPEGGILRAGHNCWRIEEARRAALLVDGAAYFLALHRALEGAERSVLVLGWDFDGSIVLDPLGKGPASRPLRDYLVDLLERRPRLEIRILVWAYSVVYAQGTSPPPAVDPAWRDHPRLHFRFADDLPFGACHHEKLVCLDDVVAFTGGMDLTALRWDLPTHPLEHPARVDGRGRPYGPIHDVQMALEGEAARALAELARSRWHEATGQELPAVTDGVTPWPEELEPDLREVRAGIARTRAAHAGRSAVRESEALLLDALAAARRSVYVESQYLTSSALGDGLLEALGLPGGPEVLMVVRRKADGLVQRYAMGENRDRLLRRLAAHEGGERLRACYPVTKEGVEIGVHSKLMVFDDRLLKVGSSNLNNRSMGFDSECDVAVEAETEEARSALRRIVHALLAEHLGRKPREVAAAVERSGLLRAVDELPDSGSGGRRLVPFEVDADGPRNPLPGTPLVDPKRPLREHLGLD